MKAWVNGASGFIGGHLSRSLAEAGWDVTGQSQPFGQRLQRGGTVFHLIARAHRRPKTADRAEYMRVNCELAVAEYRRAAEAGCAGFVFVSTAKVLGESSAIAVPADAEPRPHGVYAESKHRAELALREAYSELELPITVVRPPLVYGPGVKANFRRLLDWTRRSPVLPLGGATAPRSMISVANVVDFLGHVAERVNGYEVWNVKDEVNLSVRDLVRQLAGLMHKPIALPDVPRSWLEGIASLAGRQGMIDQLFEPFLIDDASARTALDWRAPQSVPDALEETVRWYLAAC